MLGSRVRSDGKRASLTAPSGMAQARLLSEALAVPVLERFVGPAKPRTEADGMLSPGPKRATPGYSPHPERAGTRAA